MAWLPVGCSGGSGESVACGAFGTSLFVRDRMGQAVSTFNTGEPITFELEITNRRNEPSTLTASSSCSAVVFEVTDAVQRRRWGSADGIACIQMLQPKTYAPLETVEHSAVWAQRDSDDAAVQPGGYTVAASVGQYAADATGLVDCRAELGKSATFRIR